VFVSRGKTKGGLSDGFSGGLLKLSCHTGQPGDVGETQLQVSGLG
jgi:hypothetical protein